MLFVVCNWFVYCVLFDMVSFVVFVDYGCLFIWSLVVVGVVCFILGGFNLLWFSGICFGVFGLVCGLLAWLFSVVW